MRCGMSFSMNPSGHAPLKRSGTTYARIRRPVKWTLEPVEGKAGSGAKFSSASTSSVAKVVFLLHRFGQIAHARLD